MNILMFSVREDEYEAIQAWAAAHPDTRVDTVTTALTPETVEQLSGYDAVVIQQTAKLDDQIYPRLQALGLKQISTRTAGYDMVDVARAQAHGLQVTNVPAYSPNAIAEYTIWAALNLVRHMNSIQDKVQHHDFRWSKSICATELRSLTIGIVGTGRIGMTTAQIFHAFGAQILAYDLYPNPDAPEWLRYVNELDELLAKVDLLSLHLPSTSENHHMIDARRFERMKDGVLIINTARGALLDTQALLNALDSGKVAGAALDVYERESSFVNRDLGTASTGDSVFEQLIERPNVIVTPHIAFFTKTAISNLVDGGLDSAYQLVKEGTAPSLIQQ